MQKTSYKYIYGPVSSWRLGLSLGIDPISTRQKVCTFNCAYCQLGSARPKNSGFSRKIFVPTKDIIKEVSSPPPLKIDYISFSGSGEPTLAANLGEIIDAIKEIRVERLAILTNSSLLTDKDVRRDLLQIDFVIAKLEVPSQEAFEKINKPGEGFELSKIVDAIKRFRTMYKGRLAIQSMFYKENKQYVEELSNIVRAIGADEVHIGTPIRPCSVKPLSKKEIEEIRLYFKGMKVVSVYDGSNKKAIPINRPATIRRRGRL